MAAAKKDFVLVELDFPSGKEQPAEVKEQNAALQQKYAIAAFPTLLLADAKGRPYAEAGFPEPMTPDGMLEILTDLKAKKAARDEAFAAAGKAEGVEKAKLLIKALDTVPEQYVIGGYGETIDEIAKLDPQDETGFVKKAQSQRALMALEGAFARLMEEEKFAEAATLVDKFVAEHKPEGEAKQSALTYKFFALANQEDTGAALKLADEIIAIDPDSDGASMLKQFKRQLDAE